MHRGVFHFWHMDSRPMMIDSCSHHGGPFMAINHEADWTITVVPSPLWSASKLTTTTYRRSASEPAQFLTASPPSILRTGRGSLDVPPSPVPSSWGSDSSTHVPPSPTLSTHSSMHSVHFQPQTSLALRDNDPAATTGMSSLALLGPNGRVQGEYCELR